MALVTVGPDISYDYTSLADAEAGEQADLVALDDIMQFECYAFEDTNAVDIDGWTTDATRYLRVYAPSGERHGGKWDATKYYLTSNNTTTGTLFCREEYVRFDGLQIENSSTTNYPTVFTINVGGATAGVARVSHCIFRGRTITDASHGYCCTIRHPDPVIFNCVAWGMLGNSSRGFNQNLAAGGPMRVYNCLAYGCQTGFAQADNGYDMIVKNCRAANCVQNFQAGWAWHADSDYNATDDARATTGNGALNDPPGANALWSQTFSFVDAANGDFHLLSDDDVLGLGTDLSGEGYFSDDIDYVTRSGSWDIGPDQYVASGGTIEEGDGASAGAAASTGVGQAIAQAVAAAAGAGAAAAVAQAIAASVASSSGTSTAAAQADDLGGAVAASAGAAVVTAVAQAIIASTAESTGLAAAVGVGGWVAAARGVSMTDFDRSPYRENTYGTPTHYCDVTRPLANNGTGTEGDPWNLSQVIANAAAGNVVGFLPLEECMNADPVELPTTDDWNTPAFNPSNSGTAGNPIVFVTKWAAVALPRTNLGSNGKRTELRHDGTPAVTVADVETGTACSIYGAYLRDYLIYDGFYVDCEYAEPAGDSGVLRDDQCVGVQFLNFVIEGKMLNCQSNAVALRGHYGVDTVYRNFRISNFHNDPTGSGTPQRAYAGMWYGNQNFLVEQFEIDNCDNGLFPKGTVTTGAVNYLYGEIRYGKLHHVNNAFMVQTQAIEAGQIVNIHHNLIYEYMASGINVWDVLYDFHDIWFHHNTMAIRNRTLYGWAEEAGAIYLASDSNPLTWSGTELNIEDNLVDTDGLMGFEYFFDVQSMETPLFPIDHNGYYTSGQERWKSPAGTNITDFATWQALSGSPDANGALLGTDPFVNRAALDFRVSDGHAAKTLSSTGGEVGAYAGGAWPGIYDGYDNADASALIASVAASAGVATVEGDGDDAATGAGGHGESDGGAVVSGIAQALILAAAASAGQATVTGAGAVIIGAVGASAGGAAAVGDSQTVERIGGDGQSAGVAVVDGESQAIWAALASATGLATAGGFSTTLGAVGSTTGVVTILATQIVLVELEATVGGVELEAEVS